MSHFANDDPRYKAWLKGAQTALVGSYDLCCVCWKRNGHEPGCRNEKQEFFFKELPMSKGVDIELRASPLVPENEVWFVGPKTFQRIKVRDMSQTDKERFETLCAKYEAAGVLPKGKTADMMENYDTITGEPKVEAEVDHDALDEKTRTRARKV